MFVHPGKMFGISGDRFKMFINDTHTYLKAQRLEKINQRVF